MLYLHTILKIDLSDTVKVSSIFMGQSISGEKTRLQKVLSAKYFCFFPHPVFAFSTEIIDPQEFPVNGFYEEHVKVLGNGPMSASDYVSSDLFKLLEESFLDRQNKRL